MVSLLSIVCGATYQDQWRIVVTVPCVQVHAQRDLLLAYLEVTPSTGLAELAKVLAGVERVVLLQPTRGDIGTLLVEGCFKLEFVQDHARPLS